MRVKKTNNLFWPLFSALALIIITTAGCDETGGFLPGSPKPVDKLTAQAVEIIRSGLNDPSPRIRTASIEVVARTGCISLMPQVQRLLKDDFVPVRFTAAVAVGDTHYLLAKSTVEQLLKDPDPNVRIAAAYAMYKLGFPESFDLLGEAISDRNQTVRANAAVLLGKSGDRKTLKLLYWVMKDEHSDIKVSMQAAEAIARLGDEKIIEKLWAMVISAYHDDRVFATEAISLLGTQKAREILMTMLDDDVPEVRLAAAEQLGRLADDIGKQQVLDIFEKKLTEGLENVDRDRIYGRAALAIGQIGSPELTRYLPKMLKDQSQFVRLAAARAVLISRK